MPETTSTTTPAGTTTTTSPTPPKPGWRTTEFYGSWAVKILGGLIAAGAFPESSTAFRIAGLAMTLLAYWGYTYSRTVVKSAAAFLFVCLLAGPQLSCGGAGTAVKQQVKYLEGCSAEDAATILKASQQVVNDGAAMGKAGADRVALGIDIIAQLALVHAAYAHCKGTTPPPAPVPAPPVTP